MKNFNKIELINYFITNNKSGYKTKEKHINIKFPELITEINDYNLKYFKNNEFKFTQKLYNYLYDITELPKCENCGNIIKWRGIFTEGYLKYCSKSCKNKSNLRIERMKKTNIIRYGVDSVLKNQKILDKKWNTTNNKTINNFQDKGYIILNSDKNSLTIKHPDGHIFTGNRKLLVNRLYGGYEISTILNPISSIFSTYEQEIKKFLLNNNLIIVENCRNILLGKEIDIYIPNHKLGIEFDGLYWHSNLYVENNYHQLKTNLCEENNIQLLHIFEDEWLYKKEIIKSIIKSKLNIYDNKIFARKCEIKEIDFKSAFKFLESNHLQGNINSKIRIGLFYNNELVSIMTFGKKRIAMGNKVRNDNEYEMLRFCNKLNTQVIGGASKLLNYFIKIYSPKFILTFADRRYSNGNLYNKLGFQFIENTKPNYWYFKKNELNRNHRYVFRKDVLIKEGYDKNKTEEQIMAERGYLKIYDSGNMKFIYSI